MSDTVLLRALKYDGSLNYEWPARVEYQRANLLVLAVAAGTAYRGRNSGTFPSPMRAFLWTDRWFNVEQVYDWSQGRGVRHYVNIATPVQFDGRSVTFTDLDLDVDVDSDWVVRLLDEDEYAAHSARWDYPLAVRQNVAQAVSTAQQLIEARAWPFGTSVESPRLRVRPFFWSDLELMDGWRGVFTPFDDPWIIPPPTSFERIEWYAHYIETPVMRLYAIDRPDDGGMIGHISLRDIEKRIQARLGIGLAPGEVSKGYGSEALKAFLDYYFDVLGFERMVLDVAATNERARRAYLRLGFRDYGEHHRGYAAEAQWRAAEQPANAQYRRFFRHTPWGMQMLFYDMEMTREMWHVIKAREANV
ncbi:MAG: GNAT family N-acetyltransferase [Chloroflexi bacterium]|nr:GNAT family N-acetyltransferase [Chloroflexota bacterium]